MIPVRLLEFQLNDTSFTDTFTFTQDRQATVLCGVDIGFQGATGDDVAVGAAVTGVPAFFLDSFEMGASGSKWFSWRGAMPCFHLDELIIFGQVLGFATGEWSAVAWGYLMPQVTRPTL
jgi:hypothetical protein